MRAILSLAALAGLTACESIEVQYTAPSKGGDFAAAESQANDHYEYVALPKTYILVRPVDDSAGKSAAAAKSTSGGGNGAAEKTKAEASGATSTKGADNKATAKKPSKDAATAGASGASAAAAAPAASGAEGTKNADAPVDQSSVPAAALSTVVIDGKTWEAKVIQLPDDQRNFVVKGVSGFWKSTTIGLTKQENSDLVTSVSSTAENLVPKRLGQVASVVATAIQIGAVVGVDSARVGTEPLTSFVVEVPGQGPRSDTIVGAWTYAFKYDSPDPPAGTVSYQDFTSQGMNRKVAYWPIPACRAATLDIGMSSGKVATFHLVVSSSDVIRLQPLPSKGKVDFGSVCGATASGTATSDPLTSVSDDLQALQQAIKTIKDAKAGTGGGAAAAASAPKK